MGLHQVERVPAHMRNLQRRIGWLDAVDFAGDPAKARRHLIFSPALSHQLHSNANSKKRFSILSYTLFKRVDHSRDCVETSPAIGKCADAGQHHTVGTHNRIRIVRHENWLLVSIFTCSPFEGLGSRMQIAGAIVNDGNAHRWAPGSGNRPMTSDGDG